jgi:carbonic anhydrase/acetyltransferase-like protein (isoleucine patch superfamily)
MAGISRLLEVDMALYEFEGKRPQIAPGTYVPESADVIGDVVIGRACFVGVGARIRGDYGRIRIGARTSIQENVVIHARDGGETVVGDDVQLGHGCILHNTTVGHNAVIGLGAILTDFSVVGEWAIIGEGAVVRGEIPSQKIAVGIPAKVIGEVSEQHREEWRYYKSKYAELARLRYPQGLKRIDAGGPFFIPE